MAKALQFPTSGETVGPMVIGFALSCGFFGILSQQTFTYYQRYFHDKVAYKILVAVLWVTQLAYMCFIGHATYHYTVTHYGDTLYLLTGTVVPTLVFQVLLATVSSTLVKIAFMLRVWNFSQRNLWITGFIAALIVGQAVLATGYTIKAYSLRNLVRAHETKFIATLSLSVGLTTDFVIALALCYFLRRLKTGFKHSDSLVNMLCIYAINTGLVTGLIAATTLFLYNVFPRALYFSGSYFVLGNFYAISFICTLNTRRAIRGKGTDNETTAPDGSRGNAIIMVSSANTGHSRKHSGGRTFEMHGKSLSQGRVLEIGVKQEVSQEVDVEAGVVPPPYKSGSPF